MPDPGVLEEAARLGAQALLNGVLWGVAITAGFATVIGALHRAPAATRYRLWLLALLAVALLPLMAARAAGNAWQHQVGNSTRLEEASTAAQGAPTGGAALSPGTGAVVIRPRAWTIEVPGGSWLVVLLGIGVLISGARCARLMRSLHRLRVLKRSALPVPVAHADALEPWVRRAGMGRAIELRVSDRVASPIAAGYIRPAILLPTALLERLSAEELAHVVMHEAAHLRRRDDWSLLAQRLVQAVLFFHPAVHWIGRRLELERELACDHWVIENSPSTARSYARSLVRLAEMVVVSRQADLAPSVMPRSSQLGYRVQALLSAGSHGDARTLRAAAAVGGTLLVAAAIAAPHVAPAVALQAAKRLSNPSAAAIPMLAAVPAFPLAVQPAGSASVSRRAQGEAVSMFAGGPAATTAEAVRRVDAARTAPLPGPGHRGSTPPAPAFVPVASVPSDALPEGLYLRAVEVSGNRTVSEPTVQDRPAPRRRVNLTISLAGGAALDPLRVLTEPVAAGALPYPYGGQQPGTVRGVPQPRMGVPAAGGVRLRITGGSAAPRPYSGLPQRW